MNATTILGIASIVVAFVLFTASFYLAVRGRKRSAIVLGAVAFLFMTLIPVALALFVAVPNPS